MRTNSSATLRFREGETGVEELASKASTIVVASGD